jgi:hypothetical protein
MRWIDGYSYNEKRRRKEVWHLWFAWYPVRIGVTPEHRKIYVWLESVWRKGVYISSWGDCYWIYQYKPSEEE